MYSFAALLLMGSVEMSKITHSLVKCSQSLYKLYKACLNSTNQKQLCAFF